MHLLIDQAAQCISVHEDEQYQNWQTFYAVKYTGVNLGTIKSN